MVEQVNRLRLNTIKLAGFKSFVDPTTIPFTTDLTAVVGPNGCGKSNIIDAVRWVMGESSAKYLRGDSMADVIFNGSAERKPLGRASVELLFDNPHGAIGGEFAHYEQIAIRREVTRDGQSSYFLNDTRCRRQDIRHIFLGTGLGPRSYAIIGQGTVSRLIEAKPEELRNYLEEAAGISKYKDRRRETENRMRHTRDNLDRLNDLREEIEKQLNHLQRQAEAAERYKTLKEEERTYAAQLLGVRWKNIHEQLEGFGLAVQEKTTALEGLLAEMRHLDTAIELERNANVEQQDDFQEIQERYYKVGANVSSVEQTLKHQQEQEARLREDLSQTQENLTTIQTHHDTHLARRQTLETDLAGLLPDFEALDSKRLDANQTLTTAEQAMQAWQIVWDDFNQKAAKDMQEAEVQQTRIQHFEDAIQNTKQQIKRLEEEQERLDSTGLEASLKTLSEDCVTVKTDHETTQAHLHTYHDKLKSQQLANNELQSSLNDSQRELQRLTGRHASLEALQQAALGQQNEGVMQWLKQHDLSEHQRLAQHLTVEPGWEKATETVLGNYLQAVCVDGFDPLASMLENLEGGDLTFYTASSSASTNGFTQTYPKLTDKIKATISVDNLLSGIYVVDDLVEGLRLRPTLASHESVITREGVWFGANWLRVAKDSNEKSGVIEREKALKEIAINIADLHASIETMKAKLQAGQDALQDLEEMKELEQSKLISFARKLSELESEIKVKETRIEHIKQRQEEAKQAKEDFNEKIELAETSLKDARAHWQAAMTAMDSCVDRREALQQERTSYQDQLVQSKQEAKEAHELWHASSLRRQSIETELKAKQEESGRLAQQLHQLQERVAKLAEQLDAVVTKIPGLQQELDVLLEKRLVMEEDVSEARKKLQAVEQSLREKDKQRHEMEETIQEARAGLEKLKLDQQGLQVRATTLQEQLETTDQSIDVILKDLPEDASETAWEAQLERLEKRIQRLGAINLAAIDEYATQLERKDYLDAQNEDLVSALTVLEDAIKKIDKETRQRFKETYDKVNEGFKTLFPKVFAGGSAMLELTGDDLLDTGVAVMARPPGKRNSTIHLLSGGEKALTAVALVFAIFQLNPAPFCMLDEVDAPLDDANVVRFCGLVKDMSKEIQFIFISHNKVAIEMAEQLAGVTMREPGVSRMVSVDIDAAIEMAEV